MANVALFQTPCNRARARRPTARQVALSTSFLRRAGAAGASLEIVIGAAVRLSGDGGEVSRLCRELRANGGALERLLLRAAVHLAQRRALSAAELLDGVRFDLGDTPETPIIAVTVREPTLRERAALHAARLEGPAGRTLCRVQADEIAATLRALLQCGRGR